MSTQFFECLSVKFSLLFFLLKHLHYKRTPFKQRFGTRYEMRRTQPLDKSESREHSTITQLIAHVCVCVNVCLCVCCSIRYFQACVQRCGRFSTTWRISFADRSATHRHNTAKVVPLLRLLASRARARVWPGHRERSSAGTLLHQV